MGVDVSTTSGAIDSSQPADVRTVALDISPDLIHQGVVNLETVALITE